MVACSFNCRGTVTQRGIAAGGAHYRETAAERRSTGSRFRRDRSVRPFALKDGAKFALPVPQTMFAFRAVRVAPDDAGAAFGGRAVAVFDARRQRCAVCAWRSCTVPDGAVFVGVFGENAFAFTRTRDRRGAFAGQLGLANAPDIALRVLQIVAIATLAAPQRLPAIRVRADVAVAGGIQVTAAVVATPVGLLAVLSGGRPADVAHRGTPSLQPACAVVCAPAGAGCVAVAVDVVALAPVPAHESLRAVARLGRHTVVGCGIVAAATLNAAKADMQAVRVEDELGHRFGRVHSWAGRTGRGVGLGSRCHCRRGDLTFHHKISGMNKGPLCVGGHTVRRNWRGARTQSGGGKQPAKRAGRHFTHCGA